MPKTDRSKSLEIFIEHFGKYMSTDDCMEFYSNRKKGGTETFLRSDIYSADKLAAVILEEYSVKSKMGGNVIIALPEPEYDTLTLTIRRGDTDRTGISPAAGKRPECPPQPRPAAPSRGPPDYCSSSCAISGSMWPG